VHVHTLHIKFTVSPYAYYSLFEHTKTIVSNRTVSYRIVSYHH